MSQRPQGFVSQRLQAFVSQRLRRLIHEFSGVEVPLGAVDITFYRDDVQVRGREAPLHAQPVVRATKLEFPLEGRTCILVDDVLYTGRTIRAAVDALLDYGRPRRIELVALVDRGGRELPIQPDYVVRTVEVPAHHRVEVEERVGAAGPELFAVLVANPSAAGRREDPT